MKYYMVAYLYMPMTIEADNEEEAREIAMKRVMKKCGPSVYFDELQMEEFND